MEINRLLEQNKTHTRRKRLKVALFILGGFVLLLVAADLYLRFHTRQILHDIIAYQTKGKANVNIRDVDLKLFPKARLDLFDTDLEFLDDKTNEPVYEVEFAYLGLQLESLKAFLFDRKLLVDHLVLEEPKVSVHPEKKKKTKTGNNAVHFEVGNVFIALQKIASSLHIKRFGVLNGDFTLHELAPNMSTIKIGGVHFTGKDILSMKTGSKKYDETFRSVYLRLHTDRQDLTLPNGNFRIRYSSLHIDTEKMLLKLDSLFITKTDTVGQLEASFDELKVYNFDFRSLYEEDKVNIDSVLCRNPKLKLSLSPGKKQGEKQPLTEQRIASLLGQFRMGYLGLLNANIEVALANGGGSFTTRGNSFELNEIRVDPSAEKPIDIGSLVFAIKNYSTKTRDGLYDIGFDSVIYSRGDLSLRNFSMRSSGIGTVSPRSFSIRDFQLHQLSIAELLQHKTLKAEELVLANPVFMNSYTTAERKQERPKPIREILRSLSDKVHINKISIENGFLMNKSSSDPSRYSVIGGLRSEVRVHELFDASSYQRMAGTVDLVAFDSAATHFGGKMIKFYNGVIRGKDRTIIANRVAGFDKNTNTQLNLNKVYIRNLRFNDELSDIAIDSLGYSSANIVANFSGMNSAKDNTNTKPSRAIRIHAIRAGKTKIDFSNADSANALLDLNEAVVREFALDGNGSISLTDLFLDGNGISYSKPNLTIRAGGFTIKEKDKSSMHDLQVEMGKDKDSIRASIPALFLVPDLASTLKLKHPVINELSLKDAVLFASINKKDKTNNANEGKAKLPIELRNIQLDNVSIDLRSNSPSGATAFKSVGSNIGVKKLSLNNADQQIALAGAVFNTSSMDVAVKDSLRLYIEEGKAKIDIDQLRVGGTGEEKTFMARIGLVDLDRINLSKLGRNGSPFLLKNFSAGGSDIAIDSIDKTHVLRQIKSNPSLFVKNINLSKVDSRSEMYAYGIGYFNGGGVVSLDSFSFRPAMDRETHNKSYEFQKDYIEIRTGGIRISNVDLEKIGTDSSYEMQKIEINEPRISIYKDKRLPFEHGIIKPLPVGAINRIKPRFRVDSIRLRNGRLTYEEFNDKTNSAGAVVLANLNALVLNATNHEHSPVDSLVVIARTSLQDTAKLALSFKESYTDTLSGFLLQVRVSPFSLPALNSFLPAMANARIHKGQLDSVELKIIGREYLAHGKMRMLYRNLHVELLNKANQEKKTLFTRTMSDVANLLVKDQNTKRTGTVYAHRVRERSVFHYWIKIFLSGALTNTGIANNSKQDRKYKKGLKKENVPEIPTVEL